jgi:hypothetical protein
MATAKKKIQGPEDGMMVLKHAAHSWKLKGKQGKKLLHIDSPNKLINCKLSQHIAIL